MRLWGVIGLILGGSVEASLSRKTRPNIIYMLMDDMGWGDLGVNGNLHRETPNIDELARSGVVFTDFYSAAPLCSPSRASLLTGRLPVRNGFYTDNAKMRNGYTPQNIVGGIADEEMLLSELLQKNGYRTGLVGKWHLGHREQFLPLKHGFDYWFGAPNCHFGPHDDKHTPNIPVFENEDMIGRYFEEIPIDRNRGRSNFTNNLRDKAFEFIQKSVDDQQPFFLFFTPDSSHAPVYSSPAFARQSRRGKIGEAIMELDWTVGNIMELVKSLGIIEETIIVFSSDNGGACVGPVEQCGSNGPLLCCKQTTFDGGMRVPGILLWPGTVEPNQVNNDVTGLMDLFTTGLHLAGVPVPDDRIIDGKNLLDLVKLKNRRKRKESTTGTHLFYRGDTLGAVRHGDYKMHVYTWSGATTSSQWHFCRGQNVPNVTTEAQTDHSKAPVIYNIGQDPSEKLPLPVKSAEYQQQRPILEKIIAEHQKSLVLGKPQLNYCDDSVMHWAPPGCEKLGKCLPIPPSNYAKCYWDH